MGAPGIPWPGPVSQPLTALDDCRGTMGLRVSVEDPRLNSTVCDVGAKSVSRNACKEDSKSQGVCVNVWANDAGKFIILVSVMRMAKTAFPGILYALALLAGARLAVAQQAPPQVQARGSEVRAVPEGRVLLDADVDGAAGQPLAGLGAAEFAITDNGVRVKDFDFAAGPEPDRPAEIAIVLDAVNCTFEQLAAARDGVTSYLRRDGGKLAQPVTLVLVDAFGRKRDVTGKDGVLTIPLNGHEGSERILVGTEDGNAQAALLAKQKLFPSSVLDSQGTTASSERVQLSLQALEVINHAESARPGRKLVIWIGPGWPHLSQANQAGIGKLQSYFAGMMNGMLMARITLYELNPREVTTGFNSTQEVPGVHLQGFSAEGQQAGPQTEIVSPSGETPAAVNLAHGVTTDSLTIQSLSQLSGGLTLGGERTIAQQIAFAARDASSFYVFSYALPEAARDLEYHAVQIVAHKSGARVRSQAGYYAQGQPPGPDANRH